VSLTACSPNVGFVVRAAINAVRALILPNSFTNVVSLVSATLRRIEPRTPAMIGSTSDVRFPAKLIVNPSTAIMYVS
jgi:hypothetical protein